MRKLSDDVVICEFDDISDAMIIVFADMEGTFGGSFTSMCQTLSTLPAKKLYCKDPHRMWYQKGIPGLGEHVKDVAQSLQCLSKDGKVKRLIMVGNSSGAYAAILFGILAGAHVVHAFGPQTRLLSKGDTRYPDRLSHVHRQTGKHNVYLDLKNLFVREDFHLPRIHIYYSRFDAMDHRHAEYLKYYPNVHLIDYPIVSHHVIRFFRRNGLLIRLLGASMQDAPCPIPPIPLPSFLLDFPISLYYRLRISIKMMKKNYFLKVKKPPSSHPQNKGKIDLNRSSVRTLLVFPPGVPPMDMAPLGIPQLKGYLNKMDYHGLTVIDLSPKGVKFIINKIKFNLNRIIAMFKRRRWFVLLRDTVSKKKVSLIGRRQIPAVFDLKEDLSLKKLLASALREPLIRPNSPSPILRHIYVHPTDIIGFSVLYPKQLFHAIKIAKWIKTVHREAFIVMGGPQITKHIRILKAIFVLSEYVDGLVVNDGERPLADLIVEMEKGRDFGGIPNLYYAAENGRYASGNHTYSNDFRDMVTPDFRDFTFLFLPVRMSSGCPWGKCTFCTYRLFHKNYTEGRVGDVLLLIKFLKRKYKTSFFRIIDDYMPPKTLKLFSEGLMRDNLNIYWWTFIALVSGFDPSIIRSMEESGCISVEMGLESMSARVLHLMNKPHTPDSAKHIINLFKKSKIDIDVDVMFGFPGETEREAIKTLRYLEKNRNSFSRINIQQFCLEENTFIFQNPRAFGITAINTADKDYGIRMGYRYEVSSGMTQDEGRRFTEKAKASLGLPSLPRRTLSCRATS